MPNTIGSPLYFQISKYANEQNIKVFALVSEGNFRTDGSFNIWGYNKDKKYYQEYYCLWSERTIDFIKKKVPHQKDIFVFTGASGFDRYSIYNFIKKSAYLEKKNLSNFKKVIFYAGWSFGKINYKQGRDEIKFLYKNGEDRIAWMKEQMGLVEDILRQAIENNSDTLFILKRHPNEANPAMVEEGRNEMNRLKNYANVLYIKEKEDIHDLINIADICLGFETTSSLEAWLMNEKHSILLNPDPDFKRDKLHEGSLIVKNYESLQNFINEFYQTKTIKAFHTEEKKQKRQTLIKETIGYGDGLNHLRAGFYLKKVVEKAQKQDYRHFKFSLKYFIMYLLLHIGKFFYIKSVFLKLPKLKKTVWLFERYKLSKISFFKKKYYPYLDHFYKKNQLIQKINSPEFWQKLLK